MPDLSASTEAWVEEARKNARGAEIFHQAGEWPLGVYLHAQQAIEMALKGVLIASGLKHPFTHDLESLYHRIPASSAPALGLDKDALEAQLADLSQSWLKRYPTAEPPEPPTWDEAESAMNLAKQFVEWAASKCAAAPTERPTTRQKRRGPEQDMG